jgi:hypothetical protein
VFLFLTCANPAMTNQALFFSNLKHSYQIAL